MQQHFTDDLQKSLNTFVNSTFYFKLTNISKILFSLSLWSTEWTDEKIRFCFFLALYYNSTNSMGEEKKTEEAAEFLK